MEKQEAASAEAARQPTAVTPRQLHALIAKRYKELRAQGKSGKEAMQQAREEYHQEDASEIAPAAQVAAMFGMR